jgi:hypothetical protein
VLEIVQLRTISPAEAEASAVAWPCATQGQISFASVFNIDRSTWEDLAGDRNEWKNTIALMPTNLCNPERCSLAYRRCLKHLSRCIGPYDDDDDDDITITSKI